MDFKEILNKKSMAVSLIIFILIFVIFYNFTLKQPYHLDTTSYMRTVHTFKETGQIECYYGSRCMVGYILIPFSLIIGDFTLPFTIVLTSIIGIFIYFYWVKKEITKRVAIVSSILLLLIPASLMTITHVKEEMIGVMFLAASLYAVSIKDESKYLIYLSPIFFGLSLLTKETMILFTPFYLGYIFLKYVKPEKWEDLIDITKLKGTIIKVITSIIIFLVVVLLINRAQFSNIVRLTRSPYLGQWKGIYSSIFTTAVSLWQYGMSKPIFILQFLIFVPLFLEKNFSKRMFYLLFILEFILLTILFCNNTVVHYRHFLLVGLLSFPLMVIGIEQLLDRFKVKENTSGKIIYIITAIVSILLISSTYPIISFRSSYHPVLNFYSNINISKEDSLMLGMDSCGLARYYTGIECIGHPVDASSEEASEFISKIDSYLDNGTNIYIIPDFFAYDKYGEIQKAFGKYEYEIIYENWYEDYHSMGYGYSLEEFKKIIEKQAPRCRVTYSQTGQDTIEIGINFEYYTYSVYCGGYGLPQEVIYPVVNGRVLPGFGKGRIVRLI